MATLELENTAEAIVADGKGILAADEILGNADEASDRARDRIDSRHPSCAAGCSSARRASPSISGVILQDETIRQKTSKGMPLADLLTEQGIIPGIKVDRGAKPLTGFPGEHITEGLDGLRGRLEEHAMGARFANGGRDQRQ